MARGVLYVVATPIGNLEDLSFRALETLRSVDLVAAEDTRRTMKIFERHGITGKLVSLHEHNEIEQASGLVSKLVGGAQVALVSDAGTPLVSDPGYRLVRMAAEAGVTVSPIPGASAVTAALSVAGLPTDRFAFEGFLPAKQAARLKRLSALAAETRTLVFFESSHRILASLEDLAEAFGAARKAAVCRELTKQFETVLRGSLEDLVSQVRQDANQEKGEFVIVVEGHQEGVDEGLAEAISMAKALLEHLPASQAAKVAAKLTGAPRRSVYEAIGK